MHPCGAVKVAVVRRGRWWGSSWSSSRGWCHGDDDDSEDGVGGDSVGTAPGPNSSDHNVNTITNGDGMPRMRTFRETIFPE
ncbi:hypothetical protein Tco_1045116 [Tanacetum coccineum]|uniref:Uncharacterized protein n=1 Tax=Tanacetum coccineum TaxID=301880 RepID=A0ABQ5GRU2_9ASTR